MEPVRSDRSGVRLLLVRHGITQWNLEGRYTSSSNIRLHPTAAEGLAPSAEYLRRQGIERVLTSPMRRAIATTDILRNLGAFGGGVARGGAFDGRIEVSTDLRELDFGHFEGRSRREMLEGPLAESYRDWMRVHDGFLSPPGGEEWTDAALRAGRVLDDVVRGGVTTLAVSHGYLLRILVVTAVRDLPASAIRTMPLANGSVTELRHDERSGWSLVTHNQDGVFADGASASGGDASGSRT